MISFRFTQPDDELKSGEQPMVVTLTLDTEDSEEYVDFKYEGDQELIERVKFHLADSYGTHGHRMNEERSSYTNLYNALYVSKQLDDYNPEKIKDTRKFNDS